MCIANLPPDLRYAHIILIILLSLTLCIFGHRNRPENKILVGVTPGPHEPNVDTINNFLKPVVDELKELWTNGMTIKRAGKQCGSLFYKRTTHIA